MINKAKNTMMDSAKVSNKQKFFFPKAKPKPVTVEAESQEEAEKIINPKKTA